jgi:hypothetical protein
LKHQGVEDDDKTEKGSAFDPDEVNYERRRNFESARGVKLPPVKGAALGSQSFNVSEYLKDTRVSGYGRPENVEMMARFRELETNMIDIKGNLERKIALLMEEIPSKMTRELKAVEDKDSYLWKDARNKLSQQDSIL